MKEIKLSGKDLEFGNLENEYGYNNRMYNYFKKIADNEQADADYCYIIEFNNDFKAPELKINDDIEYNDGELKWHGIVMGKYGRFILVYEP